jgi:hypothetical protein
LFASEKTRISPVAWAAARFMAAILPARSGVWSSFTRGSAAAIAAVASLEPSAATISSNRSAG